MTTPPLAAPDSEHAHVKNNTDWKSKPMDVDPPHAGPPADLDANGASHPPSSDRGPPGDAAAGLNGDAASAGGRSDGPQRGEKIIKVLSRSLFCPPFVALYSPLSTSPITLSLVGSPYALLFSRPLHSPRAYPSCCTALSLVAGACHVSLDKL